jgi:hypothetical protein
LPLAFDRTHLFGIVVVVGETPIDVGHVEVVSVGNGPRGETPLFDLFFEKLNSNPSALEVGLVVEFPHDASRHLAHTAQ